LGRTQYIWPVVIWLFLVGCVPNPIAARDPLSTYFEQADALIATQQYSQAAQLLEDTAAVYPDTPAPLIKMGQIYLVQHRWLLAKDAFNRALARDLQNPLATAGLAETLLNQGLTHQAQRQWQQAIALNPDLPGVFTGLGRTHLARLEFEAAQQAFLDQQQHLPDPEAQWFLAAFHAPVELAAANDYLLAIPSDAPADLLARRDYLLATLVPFTPGSPQVDVARATGIAMVQVQLWPLAIYALQNARAMMDSQPPQRQAEILAFLGHALAQAGRPALDLFEQARTLNPESALPSYFYGIYLRQKGALQAANTQLVQATELDPENAAIYLELAQTSAEQGDFALAESYFETATDLAPDDLQVQLARIRFYATRGYNLSESGIPAALAVVDEYPNSAEAHDLLGWMQFLAGDVTEAQTSLRQALELDENLVSAHYHLARVLDTAGQQSQAISAYRQVVDRDRAGAYRNRALEKLQQLSQ